MDPYDYHFGPSTSVLSEPKRTAVDNKAWKLSRNKHGKLGSFVEYTPDTEEAETSDKRDVSAVSEQIKRSPLDAQPLPCTKDIRTVTNVICGTASEITTRLVVVYLYYTTISRF